MRKKIVFLFLFGLCVMSNIFAQNENIIKLVNPSFEDFPQASRCPRGWFDCGFAGESAPDTQPANAWDVSQKPQNGQTYIGMVVRDNDTWESIGQMLSKPLEGDKCYNFSIYLCRSELYVSPSHKTGDKVNYTTPARLRIWGGSSMCSKLELLGETANVSNKTWQKYDFELHPKKSHYFIILEAFYQTPSLFPYNGNLLLDSASDFVPFTCNQSLVTNQPKPQPKQQEIKKDSPLVVQNRKPDVRPIPPVVNSAPKPTPASNPAPSFNRNSMRQGLTLPLDKITFEADSADIRPSSYVSLDELYDFLQKNEDIVIEIGGHTNNIPADDFCDKLSTARAKEVAEYLIGKGISKERITYKGYGKHKPIADNRTTNGRQKNQRVEIKIISMKAS